MWRPHSILVFAQGYGCGCYDGGGDDGGDDGGDGGGDDGDGGDDYAFEIIITCNVSKKTAHNGNSINYQKQQQE